MSLSKDVPIIELSEAQKIVELVVYYDQANNCLIHFYKRCVSTSDSYKRRIMEG